MPTGAGTGGGSVLGNWYSNHPSLKFNYYILEETTAADETPEQDESPQAKEPPAGELPTTTAEKVAWCRPHDAQ